MFLEYLLLMERDGKPGPCTVPGVGPLCIPDETPLGRVMHQLPSPTQAKQFASPAILHTVMQTDAQAQG